MEVFMEDSEDVVPGTQEPEQPQQGPPPTLEEEEKGGCGISPLSILMLLGVFGVLSAILAPNFIRARARGHLTACKSNLKNIGTAMEMYSTDWSGLYPPRGLAQLTPNYLKTIPECPATGEVTYVMTQGPAAKYNTQSYQDYYFVQCDGENHSWVSVPQNYPQYNGIVGLIER